MKQALALCLGLMLLSDLFADGDVNLRIQETSKQIEKNPRDAMLYFRRGELQRVHGQWMLALADFDEARRIAPTLLETDLAKGETLFQAGELKAAKLCLDRFLAKKPNHEIALVTRSRVLVGLKDYKLATEDLTRAIANGGSLKPEYYFERGQACLAMEPKNYEEALKGLEEGIQRVGPLVILEILAIDCEIGLKLWDGALTRVDLLAKQSPRKDSWLARRGEILQLAGRTKEAREAYKASLAAIQALPSHRREVASTRELESRVKAALESLKQATKRKPS
jgi:tetratricopeptide (TPR) repeat protein